MIPKIIHYCWFGKGKKSPLLEQCITSWKKLNNFQIIEWNEDNFDITSHPFILEAYKQKKYAFVSDYVRLKVLYDYGGIYLDTDVEIKKDISEFLKNNFFLGFMYDCLLGTAVIGASKQNPILLNLLDEYDNLVLNDDPNNNFITGYFLNKYPNFRLNNKIQDLGEGVLIYPKEYFERPTFDKSKGYSEHHYSGSWKDNSSKSIIKRFIRLILGNVVYKKMTHRIALRQTPFYNIYLLHRKEKSTF